MKSFTWVPWRVVVKGARIHSLHIDLSRSIPTSSQNLKDSFPVKNPCAVGLKELAKNHLRSCVQEKMLLSSSNRRIPRRSIPSRGWGTKSTRLVKVVTDAEIHTKLTNHMAQGKWSDPVVVWNIYLLLHHFLNFTLAITFSVVERCLSPFCFPFVDVFVAFKRTAWLTAGAICWGAWIKDIHDQGRLP